VCRGKVCGQERHESKREDCFAITLFWCLVRRLRRRKSGFRRRAPFLRVTNAFEGILFLVECRAPMITLCYPPCLRENYVLLAPVTGCLWKCWPCKHRFVAWVDLPKRANVWPFQDFLQQREFRPWTSKCQNVCWGNKGELYISSS